MDGDLTRLLKLEAQILWEFLVQKLLGPSSLSTVLWGSGKTVIFSVFQPLSSGQLRLRTRNPYPPPKKKVDVYVWDAVLETAVPLTSHLASSPSKKTKNLSDDLAPIDHTDLKLQYPGEKEFGNKGGLACGDLI